MTAPRAPLAATVASGDAHLVVAHADQGTMSDILVETEVTALRDLAARIAEPWVAEASAWADYRAALPDRHTGGIENVLEQAFPHSYKPGRCHCRFCEGSITGWEAAAIARGRMDS